ncbi:oligopeptidase B [Chelatococcus caeni]|uniref:Oligopeptidase B n=1 Tax=Chelatococcus caeni TaxID=1348468 RepID=A0A840BYT0_9HYPH|nr:S9 family peptidase [Chelatococcus caeni]MBB4015417.1 oligopeptidase B [Chelatococcus caeni]
MTQPLPPRAQARPVTRTIHGTDVTDDYGWLRAENWRDVLRDPALLPADIHDHLVAENAYADAILAPVEDLRRRLVAEMRGRIKEDDSSVPSPDGPYSYYVRFREGGQHPLVCRQPRDGGEEAVLLDADALAAGKAFFDLAEAQHSPNHRLLAWSADETGGELHTIRLRDLETGTDGDAAVEQTTGEVVWAGDSRSFYYVRLDENHRPSRVFRHILGTDPAGDEEIYREDDAGWFVHLSRTQSGAFGLISVSDHETSEVHLIDLADPSARPRLVVARETGHRYSVEHAGEDLVISTNADGAEDFKLVTTPLAAPRRENWRELVPHRPGIMLLKHTAFRDFLVRLEREDANPRLVVRALATGEEHAIAFDEPAYGLRYEAGHEYDTSVVRFTYSSMTTPAETYAYDMASRERQLIKRREVPSGHDPARYVTKRLFATAADGETVPISVLHRRDLALDGTAPCLLYGYGAYGIAIPADFETNRLSLVDRGFVYAIAHIRGGTEKGWRWYTDGKREKKTNSFSDFIAAGRHLAALGYTAPRRLVAHGGSAGGMLMGAVANDAPDLFRAILAEVPFVDVLNTMLDDSLPLTPPEWPEWGDPIRDEAAFRRILSYSPYDQVQAQAYPAILAVAGLSDPRVTYWEPAKWVARLRERMTGGGPIVLHTNMEAGHGGAAGRFERLEEVARLYAFAILQTGAPHETPGA